MPGSHEQTARVWALIAVPLVLIVVAAGAVIAIPPASAGAAATIAAGAFAGAVIGYARGIHSSVTLGPRRGTLVVQGGNTGIGIALSSSFLVLAVTGARIAPV